MWGKMYLRTMCVSACGVFVCMYVCEWCIACSHCALAYMHVCVCVHWKACTNILRRFFGLLLCLNLWHMSNACKYHVLQVCCGMLYVDHDWIMWLSFLAYLTPVHTYSSFLLTCAQALFSCYSHWNALTLSLVFCFLFLFFVFCLISQVTNNHLKGVKWVVTLSQDRNKKEIYRSSCIIPIKWCFV